MIEERNMSVNKLIVTLGKKIGILKIAKQNQIQQYTHSKEALSFSFVRRCENFSAPEIVAADSEQQQQNKHPTCFKVKEKAHSK